MVTQPINANWILCLALLLLSAWGWNECLRLRRMKRFGVVGSCLAASGWGVRIGGVVLRAAGTCAAAAVLTVPLNIEIPGPEGAPRVAIALDTRTLGAHSPGAPWSVGEDLERAVSRVLEGSAGCRWAIYALGDPPHLLVPDTPDAEGSLMMLRETVLGQPDAGGGLTRRSLAELAGRLSGGAGYTTLVVLTADSTDNITRIPPPETTSGAGFVMLQLAPGSGIFRIASARPPAWHWEPGPETLQMLLSRIRAAAQDREGEWSRRDASARYLAGLALVLLMAESARGLLARTKDSWR